VISSWSCDPSIGGFTSVNDYVPGLGGEQVTEMAMNKGAMTWEHTNVYASGSLIATYDSDGLHFHLDDPLGTRRAQTDYAGVLEQTCASLPFGDSLACSNSTQFPTEHHFTGKERDAESGLDYFGARYYGSNMGRFMSPDPFLNSGRPENPQTWNRYTYGLNNPLRNTDPTGLYTCSGDKSQCSGVADALKAAQGALGNLKKGSADYNNLSAAISAYGKAGVDNGVHVGFGSTSGAGNTTVGVLADANGNKVTTADNPTGRTSM
jgi:RHS repeat-associated protein